MKTIRSIIAFCPLLLLCLVGMAAATLGLRRLDNWCANQLND